VTPQRPACPQCAALVLDSGQQTTPFAARPPTKSPTTPHTTHAPHQRRYSNTGLRFARTDLRPRPDFLLHRPTHDTQTPKLPPKAHEHNSRGSSSHRRMRLVAPLPQVPTSDKRPCRPTPDTHSRTEPSTCRQPTELRARSGPPPYTGATQHCHCRSRTQLTPPTTPPPPPLPRNSRNDTPDAPVNPKIYPESFPLHLDQLASPGPFVRQHSLLLRLPHQHNQNNVQRSATPHVCARPTKLRPANTLPRSSP